MFLGESTNKLDDKGRLSIPVKYRPQLAEGAVVTRGLDQSLALYPQTEWQQIADRLAELPMTDPAARRFLRLMLSGASEVELDRQGRISLPAYLREYAGIKSTVIVAGVGSKIELWSDERWQAESGQWGSGNTAVAETFSSLGI